MNNFVINVLKNAMDISTSNEVKTCLASLSNECMSDFENAEDNDNVKFNELLKNVSSDEELAENNLSKTGIDILDNEYLNGGIQSGEVCIIAGTANSGRTSLAEFISKNNSTSGKEVLFISLDDVIEVNKLENCRVVKRDSIILSELTSLLVKYCKEFGTEVLVLDYMQKIRLDNGSMPYGEKEFSMISAFITFLIKKLNIKAYICAEVNRSCEKRIDKRPMISDIRGSSKLGEYASYVLTTYRNEYHNSLDSDHEAKYPKAMDISVVKNRFALIGTVKV